MNRRDLMKTAAAIAALPAAMLAGAREAIAARRAEWSESPAAIPVPVYSYDSRTRRTTFYRADEHTRAMQDYFRR